VIRVIIADRSRALRKRIACALAPDPEFHISGEAATTDDAIAMVKGQAPVVVIAGASLWTEQGSDIVRQIATQAPTPTVLVVWGNTGQIMPVAGPAGMPVVVELSPSERDTGKAPADRRLQSVVKALSQVTAGRRAINPPLSRTSCSKPSSPVSARPQVVAIAASTGGPVALRQLLAGLPKSFKLPLMVVQHMTHGFIDGLAASLSAECHLPVKTAVQGEPLLAGTVYIGPDDYHLGVASSGRVALSRTQPIGGFRPSATHLFQSVAEAFGPSSIAVIMTGMGQDGLEGLRAVRSRGGRVVAQDRASSVVFGMANVAVEAELVDIVLPLAGIAPWLAAEVDQK
jgi:two-component system chemotaxis response regulator CheB